MLKEIKYLLMGVTLVTSNLVFARSCTDDYIISGSRMINLLPDDPFNIYEDDASLIVDRKGFHLRFLKKEEIASGDEKLMRYSLEFLGDMYNFDLIYNPNNASIRWRQYSTGVGKRGFGGECID